MTITPINLGNSGSAALSSAGNAGAADAGSPGFADLLSFQLNDINALRQMLTKLDEKTEPLPDVSMDPGSSTDPAQLLAGILAVTPPPAPVTTRQEMPAAKIVAVSDAVLAGGKQGEAPAETLLPGTGLPLEKNGDAKAQTSAAIDSETDSATAKVESKTAKTAVLAANEIPNGNFAQTLATHASDPKTQSGRTETSAPAVTTPLNDNRWSQDFGDKVVWMARNDRQSAQITINPPQLGPVQITLDIKGDQATALFVSAHSEVRQAIENALPHLREMLANAGISLGQTNVGAQFARQDSGDQSQHSDSPRFSDDNAILHGDSSHGVTAPAAIHRGRGMVDLFA